ncbi:MAG TPA: cupin domain-containing protein [Desulfobacterales bacterium]|nr:cupin domain-containing protein [Desulfobacterales bacterium]
MPQARVTALRDTVGFQHAQDDYWYRPLVLGDNLFSYVAHVPPGGDMPASAEEAELFELSLFMLGGRLHVLFGDDEFDIAAGEALFIPRGVPFGVRNTTAEVGTFLLTFTPPPSITSVEELAERFRARGKVVKSPAEMAEMVGSSPIPGNV